MNSQNKSLLLFSIGPVQSFIAASRKTLDLFSGSMLLSKVTGAAIERVMKHGQIIFPYIVSPADLEQPLPNRFLALIERENAKTIAEDAIKASKDYIKTVSGKARSAVERRDSSFADNPYWKGGWSEQMNSFWEFYWTIIDADSEKLNDSAEYGKLYNRIERLSGERKSLRNFDQMFQEGMKCSYFQGYSALFPLNHNGKFKKANQFSKEFLSKKYIGRYKPGETLSAMAFLKREFGWNMQDGSFPSTINLANGEFNDAVVKGYGTDQKITSAVEAFISSYKPLAAKLELSNTANYEKLERVAKGNDSLRTFLKSDNQFLLQEELDEVRIKAEYGESVVTGAELEELKNKVSVLKKTVKLPIKKYYAVLYFDGDQMGKWLSGAVENDKKENFKISLQKHSEISRALKQFAEEKVPQIVEGKYLGKVIFAGGDDVIAFCTLSSLLDIVKEIRIAFEEAMASATDNFTPATGSFGIAIAHWQQSLQMVMREARTAEKFAKNELDRNAFAISVLKRSGEKAICGTSFDVDYTIIGLMKDFYEMIENEDISSSFVYTFETELKTLAGDKGEVQNIEMLLSLFKYFLLRKSESGSIENKQNREKRVNDWLSRTTDYLNRSKNIYTTFCEFTELLKTVQFMRRGND